MTGHTEVEEVPLIALKNRNAQELGHFVTAFCRTENCLYFGWYFESLSKNVSQFGSLTKKIVHL